MSERERKLSAQTPPGARKESLAMPPQVRETRRLSLSILGAKMGRYKPLLRRRSSQPVSNNNSRNFTAFRAHSVTSETTLTLPRLDVLNVSLPPPSLHFIKRHPYYPNYFRKHLFFRILERTSLRSFTIPKPTTSPI